MMTWHLYKSHDFQTSLAFFIFLIRLGAHLWLCFLNKIFEIYFRFNVVSSNGVEYHEYHFSNIFFQVFESLAVQIWPHLKKMQRKAINYLNIVKLYKKLSNFVMEYIMLFWESRKHLKASREKNILPCAHKQAHGTAWFVVCEPLGTRQTTPLLCASLGTRQSIYGGWLRWRPSTVCREPGVCREQHTVNWGFAVCPRLSTWQTVQ
jgi:hypothetical protein